MALVYEMGVIDGRKEVVEWFSKRECPCLSEGYSMYAFDYSELEDQLKEWGIDE